MNKSKNYILPLVLSDYQKNVQTLLDNLKNTFIRYRDKDKVLVLLIDGENISEDFFDYYKNIPIFDALFHKENTNEYILILKIKDEYLEDYIKFINGKYSKISEKSKAKIIKFTFEYYPLHVYDLISKVVYRDPELIQQWIDYLNLEEFPEDVDLSSKIDIIKETYYDD